MISTVRLNLLITLLCLQLLPSYGEDTLIIHLRKLFSYSPKLVLGEFHIVQNDFFFEKCSVDASSSASLILNKSPYCYFVDSKNRILLEGYWSGDVLSGRCKRYFKNGRIKITGFIVDGVYIGERIRYNKRGIIISRRYFSMKEEEFFRW